MSNNNSLPQGWVQITLGHLLRVRNGYAFKSSDYCDKGVRLIRQTDLIGPTVDISNAMMLPSNYLNEYNQYIIQKDDLLIGMSGSLGKVSKYVDDIPALQNQRTGLIIPCGPFPSGILKLLLQLVESQILAHGKGIAVQNVSAKEIENCQCPLPPLPEQHRIVEKIEELFSMLDAGVAALERVRANLKRYRASVLKAAVEGRLTAEWRSKNPDTEPAFVLLERILQERRQKWQEEQLAKFSVKGQKPPSGWQAKYKAPTTPDTSDLPELPEGWAVASLEQITDPVRVICYGILMPKAKVEEGVPYVEVKDIKNDRIETSSLHLTSFEMDASFLRSRLAPGDLLLAIRGSYGRVAIAPPDLAGANISRDVARLAVMATADHHYVALCIRSMLCDHYFQRVARGVAVKGVNIAHVKTTPIPFPHATEQVEIVAEVDRRLSVIDEMATEVEAGLKRAARLRQSILKRAFDGKLVPQDPNDEPASVLLERIKKDANY